MGSHGSNLEKKDKHEKNWIVLPYGSWDFFCNSEEFSESLSKEK